MSVKMVKKSVIERYRVEGVSRRGAIRYVKVTGRPGSWRIYGIDGLHIVVKGETISDALRLARRQIQFRPMVIRPLADPPAGS